MSYRYSNGKEVLVNTQTGDYTLTSEDNGAIVVMDKATAVAVTVPANLTVGFNCVIIQKGAGTVTVTPSGTTVNSQGGVLTTAAQYDGLWLRSTATDVFNLKVTPASSGGLTIGNAVTSGGANRVLYEDGSQNLAASSTFTFASTLLTAPKFSSSGSVAADNQILITQPASPSGRAILVNNSSGTQQISLDSVSGFGPALRLGADNTIDFVNLSNQCRMRSNGNNVITFQYSTNPEVVIGSSVNGASQWKIASAPKSLTSGAATSIIDIVLTTLTAWGGQIDVSIVAKNATDVQVRNQLLRVEAVNKGGVYTKTVTVISEGAAVSTGTLTATYAFVDGTNKTTLQITATSSITPTTLYVAYSVRGSAGDGAPTLL